MLGLGGLIGQLIDDARALAQAEIRLVKARAFAIVKRSRTAILLLLAAGVIAAASVVGLALGLVLALVPLVGALLAGLILLAGGMAVAGLLAWIAVRLFVGPAKPAAAAVPVEPVEPLPMEPLP